MNEFSEYDKDVRSLTYRILLEKFNDKYDNLSVDQKQVLKEFIYSVDSTPSLRNFYNSKIKELVDITLNKWDQYVDIIDAIKVQEVSPN